VSSFAASRKIFVGAAAFGVAMALLMPDGASARGMAAHHARIFHHRLWHYGGWVVGPPAEQFAQPTGTVSSQAAAPHCTFSRETVTVPSEDGGERKITITRC
jgi:hypothetical protein